MKNKLLIQIIIISIISFNAFGQEIEENRVDDFTGNSIKRTSWETLNMTMKFAAYFRISNIDDLYFFDLKMMIGGKVFSIDKEQELMLKLSNNEIITLPNLKHTITCNGCGARGLSGSNAQGIKVSYLITEEQIYKLKDSDVTKIRIYTTNGYVENDLKSKHNKKIKKAMSLIK